MSSAYPASKQTFTNAAGTQTLSSPDHALYHGTIQDTLGSIQDVVGTTLGTNVLKNFAAGDFPMRATGNATVGTPQQTFNGGTYNNFTAGTPAITGGTSSSGFFDTPTLRGWDNWVSANETWTYASADAPTFVITVPSDATTKYSVGMRIKLTQTTAKYFFITAVSSTSLTVYGGTDYTLANAAISSPFYSAGKSPLGFPTDPTKWTTSVISSNANAGQSTPTAGTWYNLGTLTGAIPIGAWRVLIRVTGDARRNANGNNEMFMTLSTANNTQSDTTMTGYEFINNNTIIIFKQFIEKPTPLVLSSKTTYYLNAMTNNADASIGFRGDLQLTTVDAVCSYL